MTIELSKSLVVNLNWKQWENSSFSSDSGSVIMEHQLYFTNNHQWVYRQLSIVHVWYSTCVISGFTGSSLLCMCDIVHVLSVGLQTVWCSTCMMYYTCDVVYVWPVSLQTVWCGTCMMEYMCDGLHGWWFTVSSQGGGGGLDGGWWGRGFTHRQEETCVFTFCHKHQTPPAPLRFCPRATVVVTRGPNGNTHHSMKPHKRRFSQNQSDPHPSKNQGQSSQEAGGLPFFAAATANV